MSPASYRAAPPRVGGAILCELAVKDQIQAQRTKLITTFVLYLDCALIAASRADFNRFCALS